MSRPGRPKFKTVGEIETAIAGELDHKKLLEGDLRDALVAGENTAPYRKIISEIDENVRSFQRMAVEIEAGEAQRRRAAIAASVREAVAEAKRRHMDILAGLTPAPVPEFLKGFV